MFRTIFRLTRRTCRKNKETPSFAFASDGVYEWSVFVMDSLFSLESETEGCVAARLKDFGVFNDSHKASPFGAGAATPSSMLKGLVVLGEKFSDFLRNFHKASPF